MKYTLLVLLGFLAFLAVGCQKPTEPAPERRIVPTSPSGVGIVPGNTLLTVHWKPVSGASSYNLYWSTSSGVSIASGTKISGVFPPFGHTGRTNGTNYYYVVTAVNSAGESPLSSQVSAAPIAVNPVLTKSFATVTSGSSDWVYGPEDDINTVRNLDVSLTLPATTSDVYVLLTNVANNAGSQTVGAVQANQGPGVAVPRRGNSTNAPFTGRGAPRIELSALRDLSVRMPNQGSRALAAAVSPAPSSYTVGTSKITFVDSNFVGAPTAANNHPVTLRVKQTDGVAGRTLYVWVMDNCWTGSSLLAGSPLKVDQTMVQALADKFLDPNNTNDIYGLVTNILGSEWSDSGAPFSSGGTSYDGSMIDAGGQIHIVVGDLNPAHHDYFGGGLMGYFHSWNNFLGEGSNEKELFAIDANSLANPDADGNPNTSDDRGTWSLNSYFPNEIISTLAHEFQHMIHFYQKSVRNHLVDSQGYIIESPAWINEMASMAVEDLVASQLGTSGPRGLAGTDLSTGSNPVLWSGRLPLFNGTHDLVALQAWPTWGSTDSSLPNYSNAYAFGAWLTRNYGGPGLWKSIVQSSKTDISTVVDAVNSNGGSTQTYPSLVRSWGLATLFGKATAPSGLVYSAGSGGFTFPAFGPSNVVYQTGSINLYQYPTVIDDNWNYYGDEQGPYLGPYIYGGAPALDAPVAAGGTLMYWAGTATDSWTHTLTLPPNVAAALVVSVR